MTIVRNNVYRFLCCHEVLLSVGSVWWRPFKVGWRWKCSEANTIPLSSVTRPLYVSRRSRINSFDMDHLLKCTLRDIGQSTVCDADIVSSVAGRCVGTVPVYAVVFGETLKLVHAG